MGWETFWKVVMTDIVERLRRVEGLYHPDGLLAEAADEIERLRRELTACSSAMNDLAIEAKELETMIRDKLAG